MEYISKCFECYPRHLSRKQACFLFAHLAEYHGLTIEEPNFQSIYFKYETFQRLFSRNLIPQNIEVEEKTFELAYNSDIVIQKIRESLQNNYEMDLNDLVKDDSQRDIIESRNYLKSIVISRNNRDNYIKLQREDLKKKSLYFLSFFENEDEVKKRKDILEEISLNLDNFLQEADSVELIKIPSRKQNSNIFFISNDKVSEFEILNNKKIYGPFDLVGTKEQVLCKILKYFDNDCMICILSRKTDNELCKWFTEQSKKYFSNIDVKILKRQPTIQIYLLKSLYELGMLKNLFSEIDRFIVVSTEPKLLDDIQKHLL